MAITTGDGYIAAAKQIIPYTKTAALTTASNTRYTIRGQAGDPGAATLAATAATSGGQVYTDAVAGFPVINAFGGGATGYLTRVFWNNSVVGRVELYDMLWGGNVALTALATNTVTGASSYLGRTPDGAGNGCLIFVEISTTVNTAAVTVTVNYTNQAGTAGRTTGASVSLSAMVAARWVSMPLQAGDSGVRSIQSIVVGGVAAGTGAANVLVVRPLWGSGTRIANSGTYDGIDMTGMPIVYADSAIAACTVADSTSSGIPDFQIEIANG